MASYILSALLLSSVGSNDVTLLFFAAPWCKPCAQMQPVLKQLGTQGWRVEQIDTDQRADLVGQYGIESLPTMVILSGGSEVDRMVGVASPTQIEKRLKRAAARSGSGFNRSVPQGNAAPTANSMGSAASNQPATGGPIVRGQSPGMAAASQMAVSAVAASHDRRLPRLQSAEVASEGAPNSASGLSLEQAVFRAQLATVRIRVDEGNTKSHGTGTIIDVHDQDALVLTCGHLFRDMPETARLSVDLFAGTPQEVNIPATVIDHKAEEEDVGAITFRLPAGVVLSPVQVLPANQRLSIGQPAFSFGCDHGQDPTRRDTQIININRYVGAANVEISGAPAVGRSGGGLFDHQGRLIAICNAADANSDEGIYAGAEVMYGQIARLGLRHLFAPTGGAPVQLASHQRGQGMPQQPAGHSAGPAWPDESATPPSKVVGGGSTSIVRDPNHPQQLICIVRDVNGNDRVVTIQAPSQELMQHIQQASPSPVAQ